MKICGLQKTTLLDYPGHVAATVFLGGCNFRCPFCHNSGLLGQGAQELLTKDELLQFLKFRASILEGVCVTGGEPTLQPDLGDLLSEIKSLGYLVKLDSNGFFPGVLEDLMGRGLLDYIAMDIKASPENYGAVCGVPGIGTAPIEESVRLLKENRIPYEFRTTVVKGLHTAEDFYAIGRWLQGGSRYYLQSYMDSGQVLCPGFSSFSKDELLEFQGILKPYIPYTELRGVD